jgi:hypothetical protein
MSLHSDEDQHLCARPWFTDDCQRRFKSLVDGDSGKLGAEQLEGLFKMFPTLSLDLAAEGQVVHAADSSHILSVFDSDCDGFISEQDFVELLRFCNAWRHHFYISEAKPTKPPATAQSLNLGISGSGFRKARTSTALPNKRAASASGSSGKIISAKEAPPPGANRNRRGSGFGMRLFNAPEETPETGASRTQTMLAAATDAIAVAASERPRSAGEGAANIRDDDDASTFMKGSRAASLSRLGTGSRRKSAPCLINLDASLGSFYSTFAGVRRSSCVSRDSSDGGFSDCGD